MGEWKEEEMIRPVEKFWSHIPCESVHTDTGYTLFLRRYMISTELVTSTEPENGATLDTAFDEALAICFNNLKFPYLSATEPIFEPMADGDAVFFIRRERGSIEFRREVKIWLPFHGHEFTSEQPSYSLEMECKWRIDHISDSSEFHKALKLSFRDYSPCCAIEGMKLRVQGMLDACDFPIKDSRI